MSQNPERPLYRPEFYNKGKIEELEKQNKQLQQLVDTLRKENQKLAEEIGAETVRYRALSDWAAPLQTELSESETKLTASNDLVRSQSFELASLDAFRKDVAKTLKLGDESKPDRTILQLQSLLDENNKLEQQCKDAKIKIDRLNETIETLRSENKERHRILMADKAELINNYGRQLDDKDREIARLRGIRDDAAKALNLADRNDEHALMRALHSLVSKAEELDIQVKKYLGIIQNQRADLFQKESKLEEQSRTHKAQIYEMTQNFNKQLKDKSDTIERLLEFPKRVAEILNLSYDGDDHYVRQNLESLVTQCEEQEEQLEANRALIRQLEEEVSILKPKVEELTQQLDAEIAESQRLQSDLAKVQHCYEIWKKIESLQEEEERGEERRNPKVNRSSENYQLVPCVKTTIKFSRVPSQQSTDGQPSPGRHQQDNTVVIYQLCDDSSRLEKNVVFIHVSKDPDTDKLREADGKLRIVTSEVNGEDTYLVTTEAVVKQPQKDVYLKLDEKYKSYTFKVFEADEMGQRLTIAEQKAIKKGKTSTTLQFLDDMNEDAAAAIPCNLFFPNILAQKSKAQCRCKCCGKCRNGDCTFERCCTDKENCSAEVCSEVVGRTIGFVFTWGGYVATVIQFFV